MFEVQAPFDVIEHPVPGIKKVTRTISSIDELESFSGGDQVKVRLQMPRSEYPDWKDKKKEIASELKNQGVTNYIIELQTIAEEIEVEDDIDEDLFQTTDPKVLFKEFCHHRELDNQESKAGLSILESYLNAIEES